MWVHDTITPLGGQLFGHGDGGIPTWVALAGRASCPDRAPLSLQRKRWERKPRGGIPPSGLPQSASRLSFRCGNISKVRRGQFRAFRLSGKRCTLLLGAAPEKAALLEGSGEGNEKFPSPPFLSPVSFPRKEIGRCPRRTPARRGHTPSAAFRLPFLLCHPFVVTFLPLSWYHLNRTRGKVGSL